MLLVKSHKWGRLYTIPGGHVEVGEGLIAALKREVKEEVGLDIKKVRFLAVQEAIFTEEFWKPRHFIFFDFVCSALSDRVKVDCDEIQGYRWVKPERALRFRLDSFTRKMVKTFLSEGGATR